MRLFYLSPHLSHLEALERQELGEIELSLLICRERHVRNITIRGLQEHYDLIDAYAGRPPACLENPRWGVPASLLEQLAPYEATTKLLIDRHNWTDAPLMKTHKLYLRYVAIWSHLLDQLRPDAVVLHDVPHRGFDHVLYGLCLLREIPISFVVHTLFKYRVTMMTRPDDGRTRVDLSSLGIVEESQSHGNGPDNSHEGHLEAFAAEQRDVERAIGTLRLSAVLPSERAMNHGFWLGLPKQRRRGLLRLESTTGFRWVIHQLKVRHEMRRALRTYERLAEDPPRDRPTVYFPLHLQPEATTVPRGGQLFDQINDVRMLSEAVPPGWSILVKEHPQMARYREQWVRARDTGYYEELAQVPNVVLVPFASDQDKLIRQCRVLATVTGTSGWEALLAGRHVMHFGAPWYFGLPGAHEVGDHESIRLALASAAAANFQVDGAQFARAAAHLQKAETFSGIFHDRQLPESRLKIDRIGDMYWRTLLEYVRQVTADSPDTVRRSDSGSGGRSTGRT